jgi:hypothetical protein
MKSLLIAATAAALLSSACSTSSGGSGGPATRRVGVPSLPVDESVVAGPAPSRQDEAPRLPDRIVVPASYQLMLLDGHLTLVRETDPLALQPTPASMRVIEGELARGELAYQPALLPQELAAEVAAGRESAARMDDALGSVMERSRELSREALALKEESRRLAELLSADETRIRDLEAAAAPKAPAARTDPASDSP